MLDSTMQPETSDKPAKKKPGRKPGKSVEPKTFTIPIGLTDQFADAVAQREPADNRQANASAVLARFMRRYVAGDLALIDALNAGLIQSTPDIPKG